MSKASMCIKMLQILNTGRIYKISELSDLLETNPRNIVEYKRELEECGYYIVSIPGRYGGYQLDNSNIMPALKLTQSEKDSLNRGTNYLLSRNDFLDKNQYLNCISKIYSSIRQQEFDNDVTIINRFPLCMSENDLALRYDFIKDSINNKKTIKFSYISLKNIEKEYLFDPYELFMYNNSWYVIGWNKNKGDIGYFKINRITKFETTNQRFVVWKCYKRADYLDDFGFKNNGEWYHVEFKATGPYASLVKERIYGKNQEVISVDDNSTLVKVDMQNEENILVFVLGFNKNIEILEPAWLKEKLLDYGKFLNDVYNNEKIS